MLVLGTFIALLVAAIAVAILVKFQVNFRKQSLTVGTRSPVEYRDYPAELLQHIRETNYVWHEVDHGSFVGVLDRGFGRYFAISWQQQTDTLTLTDEQDFRLGGARLFRNSHSETIVLDSKTQSQLREDVDSTVINHVRLPQPAVPGRLPRARAQQ